MWEQGAWEAWLEFFLEGVAETADRAVLAASRIVELFRWNRERIARASERTGSALRRYEALQEAPYATAGTLVQRSRLSAPTVDAVLAELEQLGAVDEVTGRCRGRVFASRAYLEILTKGATPLAASRRRAPLRALDRGTEDHARQGQSRY